MFYYRTIRNCMLVVLLVFLLTKRSGAQIIVEEEDTFHAEIEDLSEDIRSRECVTDAAHNPTRDALYWQELSSLVDKETACDDLFHRIVFNMLYLVHSEIERFQDDDAVLGSFAAELKLIESMVYVEKGYLREFNKLSGEALAFVKESGAIDASHARLKKTLAQKDRLLAEVAKHFALLGEERPPVAFLKSRWEVFVDNLAAYYGMMRTQGLLINDLELTRQRFEAKWRPLWENCFGKEYSDQHFPISGH